MNNTTLMPQNNRILTIDFGSLSAQSYSAAIKHLKDKPEIAQKEDIDKAVHIFFKTLLNLSLNFGSIVLCLDRYPTRKLQIYSKYKEARFSRYKKTHIDIEAGKTEVPQGENISPNQYFRKILEPLLDSLPITQVHANGEEADDVINTVINQLKDVTHMMFTRDTDIFQLHDPQKKHFVLYTNMKYRQPTVVTPEMILEKYRVPAKQIPLYKAFLADKGDSIPRVKSIHEKVVINTLMCEHTTVSEVMHAYDNKLVDITKWHKKWPEYFESFRDQAYVNEKLATLRSDIESVYTYGSNDYVKFKELYSEHTAKFENSLEPLDVWNNITADAHNLIPILENNNISLC